MAALAHLGYGVHTVCKGKYGVDAESVHADVRSGADQLFKVFEIGGIPGVADDYAGKIHAFLVKDLLLRETDSCSGVGMSGDGHTGLAVRLRGRAQDSFYVLCHPRL